GDGPERRPWSQGRSQHWIATKLSRASVASADSAITLPARAAKKYRSFGAGAPRWRPSSQRHRV
ncbi:hypothetical protein B0H10DRAFT_2107844, partial [Mycena sp. CBHHK59/15]